MMILQKLLPPTICQLCNWSSKEICLSRVRFQDSFNSLHWDCYWLTNLGIYGWILPRLKGEYIMSWSICTILPEWCHWNWKIFFFGKCWLKHLQCPPPLCSLDRVCKDPPSLSGQFPLQRTCASLQSRISVRLLSSVAVKPGGAMFLPFGLARWPFQRILFAHSFRPLSNCCKSLFLSPPIKYGLKLGCR